MASDHHNPGGSFLIHSATPGDVFTPEEFTDEQKQIAAAAEDFAEHSVLPHASELEGKNFVLMRKLLRQAGEMGLLGIDLPEEFGGLDLNKITSALVADRIAVYAGFSVSFSAHAGIGTLPLAWYGSAEQKKKYLPKLASGEWIGAYALSEASSGSDAMNIRTRARLSEDGKSYILDGEKMWTSNAGFADLFTVFAKIDGERFTAFLVEAGTPGFTVGKEEHKMGIRGSSTCPLSFSRCAVPVENLLGKPGQGHKIAFQILNVGRYKLGAAAIGAARFALRSGIRYARERHAFGKPIASFGLIQEKIAESASLIFAGEALVYRLVGAIDASLADLDRGAADYGEQMGHRIGDFIIECSIVKVWCSEMLDHIVDHMLQIHGGYGYTEDYPAERNYRDSRINRIFEGTNEINRLVISGWTLRRAAEGKLPIEPSIRRLMDEILTGTGGNEAGQGPLASAKAMVAAARQIFLFTAGTAFEKHPGDLETQQEIMGGLADIISELLTMESAVLRAEKMSGTPASEKEAPAAMAQFYAARSFTIVENTARRILPAVSQGDDLHTRMSVLRRLSKHPPIDTIGLGRVIAAKMFEAGRYVL